MGIYFDIVNEAYFGKTKDVKAIEEAISVARKPYLGKKYCGSFYDDKNIIAVGDVIKKAFDFPCVDFNLKNDPTRNAFCYPVGTSLFNSGYLRNVKINDDGKLSFRGNGGQFYCYIRCTTGLWSDTNFSNSEITAILLHEIGHIVQHTLGTGMQSYCTAMIFAEILTCIANPANIITYGTQLNPTFRGFVNEIAKESRLITALLKGGSSLKGIGKMFTNNIVAIINALTPFGRVMIPLSSTIASVLLNPLGTIFKIVINTGAKGAEYSADNFPTMYGYGSDLSSALAKMEYSLDRTTGTLTEKFMGSVPVIRAINDFMSIPATIIMSPFEAHPVTPKRINNVIKSLEAELAKSDMSPELKKEVKKSIEDMKDLGKKYENIDNGGRQATRAWLSGLLKSGRVNGTASNLAKTDILDDMLDESVATQMLEKYDSDLYVRLESVNLI